MQPDHFYFIITKYGLKPTQYPLSETPHRVTGVSLPATLRKGCEQLALIFDNIDQCYKR